MFFIKTKEHLNRAGIEWIVSSFVSALKASMRSTGRLGKQLSLFSLVYSLVVISWWRTLFLDDGEGREEHIASLPFSPENLPPPEVNCRIIWSCHPCSPGSCRCCCQWWEASGGRTSSPSLRSPSFLELGLTGSLERCCRRLGRPRTCEHIIVVLFVNLSGIHTCFPVLV